MTPRLLLAAPALLTLALCLVPPPSVAKNSTQDGLRSVEKLKLPKEPVKIVGTKNNKRNFKLEEEFSDDDEWIDGFAVTVLNTSSKSINSLRIDLTFVRPPGHASSNDPPLLYPLQFNPSPFHAEHALRDRTRVVRPGESIELTLSEEEYAGIKRFLKQLNYPPAFHRIQVSINTVGFDDGTAWSAGTEFRPDINHPGRLIPEEEEPRGRAQRSAVFLWSGRAGFDNQIAPALRLKASWGGATKTAQISNPCGRKVFSPRSWCPPPDPALTCSVEYDEIDTSGPLRNVEAKPRVEPCLKWDSSRSVWIQCGTIRIVPRAVPCTQPPPSGGGCVAAGFDGSCPSETYPDGFGMCCSGNCNGTVAAPVTAAPAPDTDGPAPSLPESGGCACDSIQRMDCLQGGGEWLEYSCACVSPIVIDLDGDGFDLTDGAGGVTFDFAGDGTPRLMSWTAAGSDDSWLFLDRNGNRMVDNGQELFGTSTPQPAPSAGEGRNGFAALAVYDLTGNGGNADGVIDARDAIYAALRLWRDVNHNGVSEPGELHGLASVGVSRIDLDYKESKRTDEHGNRFRFRAKVDDARGMKVSRWAWDVFPVKPQPQ